MNSSLWQDIKTHPMAVVFSLAVHVVLVGLLSFNLSSSTVHHPQASKKETIKAVVVDAKEVDAELSKIIEAEKKETQKKLNQKKKLEDETRKAKKEVEKEKKRLAELEKKKKKEALRLAEIKKQKQAEEKKRQEAEKKRIAEEKKRKELEKQRIAEEKAHKAKEAEEKRRQQAEEELRKRLAEEERKEEEARQQKERNNLLNSLRAQYIKMIVGKVERNWIQPATVAAGKTCEVYVTQSPVGDVISVEIKQCSGDPVFQRSIERAVRKASPLPPAPGPDVFDKEIHFTFISK